PIMHRSRFDLRGEITVENRMNADVVTGDKRLKLSGPMAQKRQAGEMPFTQLAHDRPHAADGFVDDLSVMLLKQLSCGVGVAGNQRWRRLESILANEKRLVRLAVV